MAKQKNKSHKKKRIAKHILQARQRQTTPEEQGGAIADGGGDGGGGAEKTSLTSSNHPSSKSSLSSSLENNSTQLQKYIQLGQQYLSEWDHQRKHSSTSTTVGIWKFHKNTQTWLLRNMYDADKVPKASFQILMEYMEGLKGEATREWVNKDAIRRVLRYKEWEKRQGGKLVQEEEGKEETKKTEEQEKMDREDVNQNGDSMSGNNGEQEEEERFKSLSDHDKRKEYKRARKVLEAVKKQKHPEQQ